MRKDFSVELIHQVSLVGIELLMEIHSPGLNNSKYFTGIFPVKKELTRLETRKGKDSL